MTALSLLLWIVFAILLQLAIYLAIAFARHWGEYRKLQRQAASSLIGVPLPEPEPEDSLHKAAWQGFREFRVESRKIEDAFGTICSFYLKPVDGAPLPSFQPGQFLTFRFDLPKESGGSEQIIRCYSLSDAPNHDYYRISVKRVPAPTQSAFPPGRYSNFLHDHVKIGDRLYLRAPSGHFYLIPGDDPVVLIGGGIGITPMLSMIEWMLTQQKNREIWLFYGVRDGREAIMRTHLQTLAKNYPNFHLYLCFSQPLAEEIQGSDYQHAGYVDVALLRMKLLLKPYHFYICGPAPMMESLVPSLEEWGVPPGRIHFEAFGPASVKRADTTAAVTETSPTMQTDLVITFRASGKQLLWNPATKSLLEFAETEGIALDSGCRAGSCGCCQTVIEAGEIAYRQKPDYDPEPGTCLPCVCFPKTNVTLKA
ncbi:MAG: 2Fe-2S iron-sulfur cluster-binding protein [Betaproteobacteria bacterium]|nr:2Fe-2S iron-sulfur cluster-binding protein [Betaproteobacteria bacterium]